jgi:hypothetical protein
MGQPRFAVERGRAEFFTTSFTGSQGVLQIKTARAAGGDSENCNKVSASFFNSRSQKLNLFIIAKR